MSKPFAKAQSSNPSSDLQVQHYKRIGIPAVAAALEVMVKAAAAKNEAPSEEQRKPEIVQSDNVVAPRAEIPNATKNETRD